MTPVRKTLVHDGFKDPGDSPPLILFIRPHTVLNSAKDVRSTNFGSTPLANLFKLSAISSIECFQIPLNKIYEFGSADLCGVPMTKNQCVVLCSHKEA